MAALPDCTGGQDQLPGAAVGSAPLTHSRATPPLASATNARHAPGLVVVLGVSGSPGVRGGCR